MKTDHFSIDVQPLSLNDLKTINGGELPNWLKKCGKFFGAFGIVLYACEIVDNWDKIVEGWNEGAEAAEEIFNQ
jgi:hypothetical protein